MKKTIIIIGLSIAVIYSLLLGYGYVYNLKAKKLYEQFGKWEASNSSQDGQLPWISISWNTDSLGNKMAMFVPVKIENLPNEFRFQFDDGANLSMLYGNPLRSFSAHYPILQQKLHTELIHKDAVSYLTDLHLEIGSVFYSSPQVSVMSDFGDTTSPDSVQSSASVHDMGTIGADICKNKVLIIDYRGNRLCIVDSIPAVYHTAYSDITLDNQGRPLLDMAYKDRHYKILFDCGSSRFQLLTTQKTVGDFSVAPATDSFSISSWGKKATMIGHPMVDSFTLAGHRFGNIKVYNYEDAKMDNIPNGCDGITGNALFLDKILIIDFKNKKAGLM